MSERVYTKKHLTKVQARWTGIWEVSERVYTREHLTKVQARTKSKVEAGKWAKRLAITKKIGEGKDRVKVLGEHVGELEGNGLREASRGKAQDKAESRVEMSDQLKERLSRLFKELNL